MPPEVVRAFHRDLAAWYACVRRDLPWRRTADPYAITVSEFMLQQTQVATVIPYYERWLRAFPDWRALAAAAPEKVIKQWEGLGYYQRARNLQKLAQAVAALPGARLPETVEGLRALPGIGPYTAGAVASLALGKRAALLDGNVIRVFARVFGIEEEVGRRDVQLRMWAIAEALLPEAARCADHNSSLMELGALVCAPQNPSCLLCPLRKVCRVPGSRLPNKAPRAVERREEEIAVIAQKGKWWCEQAPEKGRLGGFWRFPHWDAATMARGKQLASFLYSITKYRVTLTAWEASFQKGAALPPGRWCSRAEMEALSMPSAHRRLRDLLPDA